MNTSVFIAVSLIMIGCIANNFVLELLIKVDPGVGNLMTFLQFCFVAASALPLVLDWKTFSLKQPKIPIRVYIMMDIIFFTLSVINNKAFDYAISQPIHMVFRSSSLLSTLLLGFLFFKKRYSLEQCTGAVLVTIGIITVTFAEANQKAQRAAASCLNCGSSPSINPSSTPQESDYATWLVGISMLAIALIMSSVLGHVQEWSYRKYGKDWKEGMFYTHLLGIPYFAFFYSDIQSHATLCSNSQTIEFASFEVPSMWLYMGFNLITQLVCIYGVYILTRMLGTAGTLSCTLTLTLRKFISLIISILYFSNPFTTYHWIGSALVFVGGGLYSMKFNFTSSKSKKE